MTVLPELHETPMGRKFFQSDFPLLVEEIAKLNENIEKFLEKLEESD